MPTVHCQTRYQTTLFTALVAVRARITEMETMVRHNCLYRNSFFPSLSLIAMATQKKVIAAARGMSRRTRWNTNVCKGARTTIRFAASAMCATVVDGARATTWSAYFQASRSSLFAQLSAALLVVCAGAKKSECILFYWRFFKIICHRSQEQVGKRCKRNEIGTYLDEQTLYKNLSQIVTVVGTKQFLLFSRFKQVKWRMSIMTHRSNMFVIVFCEIVCAEMLSSGGERTDQLQK